jgi:hypothetical protein
MADKKNSEEKPVEKKAAEAAAKKAGAKKPAAKKSASKEAAGKKPEKRAGAAEKPPREEIETVLDERAKTTVEESPAEAPAQGMEEELSEEEVHRLVEESLEKVTVTDIVLNMMNQLASVGYMKMGLPESVNLKYRDFAQARLAIDTLEAMIKGAEGKITGELLQPFRGTLANLQMNFVQLSRK